MTNAETISKLNEALTTLIKAYEELQGENNKLKNRITELEDEVLELETVKEDLEKNVDEFKNHTQEDNSNITSMLGKIESLLNNKPSSSTENKTLFDTPKVEEKEEVVAEEPNILNTPAEDTSSNKIDLNRMASLLNGFNH